MTRVVFNNSSSSMASSEGLNEDSTSVDNERKDSKRKSRNLSEKKRRDQFNELIGNLYSLVYSDDDDEASISTVSGHRKVDKSTVLRSAITYIEQCAFRNCKDDCYVTSKNKIKEEPNLCESLKPMFLSTEEYVHLMLEAFDAFIFVVEANTKGDIIYASESILPLLGHYPSKFNDFVNEDGSENKASIYDFIHESEKAILTKLLLENDEKKCVPLTLHFKRIHSFRNSSSEVSYEPTTLLSSFEVKTDTCNANTSEPMKCCVLIAKLQFPKILKEIHMFSSQSSDHLKTNEFISRHSLEWKFLYVDQRASIWIGYLPFELLGTSGYDYCHWEDINAVIAGHEQLMLKGEGVSCDYRFQTKGHQWLWLRTKYSVAYHQWNSKPELINCTHIVICIDGPNQKPHNFEELSQTNQIENSWYSTIKKPNSNNLIPKSKYRTKHHRRPESAVAAHSSGFDSRKMNSSSSDTALHVNSLSTYCYASPVQATFCPTQHQYHSCDEEQTADTSNQSQIMNSLQHQTTSSIIPQISLNSTRIENQQCNPSHTSDEISYLVMKRKMLSAKIKEQTRELQRVADQLKMYESRSLYDNQTDNRLMFEERNVQMKTGETLSHQVVGEHNQDNNGFGDSQLVNFNR